MLDSSRTSTNEHCIKILITKLDFEKDGLIINYFTIPPDHSLFWSHPSPVTLTLFPAGLWKGWGVGIFKY